MACEKLCKAYLIESGADPGGLQTSHGYISGPLPNILRQQILHTKQDLTGMQGVLTHARHLANEIEVLSPAVTRDGRRPDNCEYPWEIAGRVLSPLDQPFNPPHLSTAPAGRTFVKLLRGSIDRILDEIGTLP